MELDTEVFSSPGYWILTIGSIVAVLMGFAAQNMMGTAPMKLWIKIVILLCLPVISYIVTWRMSS